MEMDCIIPCESYRMQMTAGRKKEHDNNLRGSENVQYYETRISKEEHLLKKNQFTKIQQFYKELQLEFLRKVHYKNSVQQ